jgi:O-antigen/teichoic acid export membrane protein
MLKIIVRYLWGQGIIAFINILVGIFFIRWLPIEEFAIYALVVVVQSVVAAFSDFGVAGGVNTLTSQLSKKNGSTTVIVQEAFRLRRQFIPFAIFTAIVLGWFLLSSVNVTDVRFPFLVICAILSGLMQSHLTIVKALLNARFQSDLLFKLGIAEAASRLGLSFLCFWHPSVEVAVLINLIATFLACLILLKTTPEIQRAPVSSLKTRKCLVKFTLPLIPSTIYSIAQSHIGIFILSIFGTTQMIAETSALSRLSQVFSLLLVLGPFWIQPHFAKINSRIKFIKDLIIALVILSATYLLIISSTYFFPQIWLWFLGVNYRLSNAELPIAMISSVIYLTNTFFYTVALSRNATNLQSSAVVFGLIAQMIFIFLWGIETTIDALWVNMLPGISSLFIQIFIVGSFIFNRGYKWGIVVE